MEIEFAVVFIIIFDHHIADDKVAFSSSVVVVHTFIKLNKFFLHVFKLCLCINIGAQDDGLFQQPAVPLANGPTKISHQ